LFTLITLFLVHWSDPPIHSQTSDPNVATIVFQDPDSIKASPCGVDRPTFSDVFTIVDKKCVPCHSETTANGDVILDSEASLREVAASGRFTAVILQEPGIESMPPRQKLDSCAIATIVHWLDQEGYGSTSMRVVQ